MNGVKSDKCSIAFGAVKAAKPARRVMRGPGGAWISGRGSCRAVLVHKCHKVLLDLLSMAFAIN
jgi:hypothetical protein